MVVVVVVMKAVQQKKVAKGKSFLSDVCCIEWLLATKATVIHLSMYLLYMYTYIHTYINTHIYSIATGPPLQPLFAVWQDVTNIITTTCCSQIHHLQTLGSSQVLWWIQLRCQQESNCMLPIWSYLHVLILLAIQVLRWQCL